MFRNASLAGFLVTIAVIVPAGWHALGADIQTDGKRLRPLQQSFEVDGTRITLDVDRSVVMTGATVKATLVAFSDTPKQVTVDLLALHTSNYEGARVETPWIPIDHETLKLTAAPHGGKPVETAITLGERPEAPALVDSFKIYVSAHGDKPPKREYSDGVDYDVGISEGRAAAVAITGWSGNNLKMSIRPEGRPTGDAPFTIAVRITNTSGQVLANPPYVSLTTEAALEGRDEDGREEASVVLDQIEPEAPGASGEYHEPSPLERGASMITRYRVTPKRRGLGKITFLASAFAYDEAPGPVTAGAMDARTFTLAESAPTMAAK